MKIRESSGARYGYRVIASTENDFGATFKAFRDVLVNIFVTAFVVTGNNWNIATIDWAKKTHKVYVILEHVG